MRELRHLKWFLNGKRRYVQALMVAAMGKTKSDAAKSIQVSE